ncbi:copper ion binding protein [Deinococcus radiophilus]|uniref:copper ion binding protein n=1 Tax=Deinococcus radiophilus TaxID=32062 RepID=UPI00361361ED
MTETQTIPKELQLAVEGMTCAACVGRVEQTLNKVPGVLGASVNLATETANVHYDPAVIQPEQLAEAVQSAGYAVGSQELSFGVSGMTCAACVGRVERALNKVPGVLGASVNLATEAATVRYTPGTVTPDDLFRTVEDAGYGVEGQVTEAETAAETPRTAPPPACGVTC